VDERPGRTLVIVSALTDLQLLGEFALRSGARVVLDESWKRGRAKSLLKIVALAPGHRLHREQVTEALWPELDPDAAMNQLYKSLHFLKAEMALFGLPSPLGIVDQHVSLGGAVDVDVDRFRSRADLAPRGVDDRAEGGAGAAPPGAARGAQPARARAGRRSSGDHGPPPGAPGRCN
jgi:DNA-binding SARP family transcriptional activator